MTFVNSTPTQSTNHKTGPITATPWPTLAEQHRALRQARASVWAKLRPWLLAGAIGLLLGGAFALYASYQVMPPVAQHVQNVFVNINGRPAVILSGDVVFDSTPLPPAPAQP